MHTAMFLAHFNDGELVEKRKAPTFQAQRNDLDRLTEQEFQQRTRFNENENFDQQHQPHHYNNHNDKQLTAAQTRNYLINRWFRVEKD